MTDPVPVPLRRLTIEPDTSVAGYGLVVEVVLPAVPYDPRPTVQIADVPGLEARLQQIASDAQAQADAAAGDALFFG